jgi:thioredoxin-like negative regulator of GroEL
MKVVKIGNHNTNHFHREMKGSCIILFHHPQCPHCVSLRPIWEKVKKANANRPIKIVEVDAEALSNLNHPIQNEVRGFPQIMRTENGKNMEDFNQMNTPENLSAFVNRSSPMRSNKTTKRKTNKKKRRKTKGKR